MVQTSLFIPFFGGMLQGLDYDMALKDNATHSNSYTQHPIEDPERSFLMDHNREEPLKLFIDLSVSTRTLTGPSGLHRLPLFYDRVLARRRLQSVRTDAFLTVFSGVRIYRNMAIAKIRTKRGFDDPDKAIFSIELVEFRFATSPTLSDRKYPMRSNAQAKSNSGETVVSNADRPITVQRIENLNGKSKPVTPVEEGHMVHNNASLTF